MSTWNSILIIQMSYPRKEKRRKNIHHDSDPQASTKETLVFGDAFLQKMYVCAFNNALLNSKGAEMTNLG